MVLASNHAIHCDRNCEGRYFFMHKVLVRVSIQALVLYQGKRNNFTLDLNEWEVRILFVINKIV